MDKMPAWADAVLVPLISILLAAVLSALVILAIGENPIDALELMVQGALMRSAGWGYTLYYTTNFIFTGLCVAIAFHAKMFNIGGEGQAMIGGLGVALADGLMDVPVVSGAAMMVPRQAFLDHGGFDERYFLHVEDIDLCRQVRAAGGRTFHLYAISVPHKAFALGTDLGSP